ncbi:hypothetical protein OYC64_006631 [Pagothenia borchgrevinki]|uniref:Uncharacterized protein n=1 Tax=Pagothenia borchgrevinki TaxID=8213 RepID=A0ABD2GKN4_PAGBO
MAEERRRSKEENAAAADKAARKDVKRFLADGDEDLELESGAEDEFVPEVELFPETEPEPTASTKVQKNYDDIPNIALASVRYGIGLRSTAALIGAGIITEHNTTGLPQVPEEGGAGPCDANCEKILQTLLCSEDQKEIIEGVILAIRGEGDPDTQLGDSSVRTRRTPDINCDASSIGDLISWSEGVSEPPLTCLLSTSEVKNVIKTPMEVLNWPCHTQSIERVVKMVTEASAKYFSQEKRDGGIRAQETSRRLMSNNESKQDLCNLAKFKKSED